MHPQKKLYGDALFQSSHLLALNSKLKTSEIGNTVKVALMRNDNGEESSLKQLVLTVFHRYDARKEFVQVCHPFSTPLLREQAAEIMDGDDITQNFKMVVYTLCREYMKALHMPIFDKLEKIKKNVESGWSTRPVDIGEGGTERAKQVCTDGLPSDFIWDAGDSLRVTCSLKKVHVMKETSSFGHEYSLGKPNGGAKPADIFQAENDFGDLYWKAADVTSALVLERIANIIKASKKSLIFALGLVHCHVLIT
jgi:hypothetical protein